MYGNLLNISSLVLADCLFVVQSCKSPVNSFIGSSYSKGSTSCRLDIIGFKKCCFQSFGFGTGTILFA